MIDNAIIFILAIIIIFILWSIYNKHSKKEDFYAYRWYGPKWWRYRYPYAYPNYYYYNPYYWW